MPASFLIVMNLKIRGLLGIFYSVKFFVYICSAISDWKMDTSSLIERILTSPAGSLGFVVSLLIVAFGVVYWVTRKVTQIQSSHDHLKADNDKTCDKLEKHSDKVDRHMDEIRKDISYLKAMIDVYKSAPGEALAKSHSPVSLTEKGKEVASTLGVLEMIGKNWSKIVKELDENIEGKNAYDIQEYCLETATIDIEKFLDEESIEKIKLYAFNEGRPIAYYAPLFGIMIRDKYFEYKEIEIKEIDETDPNKQ